MNSYAAEFADEVVRSVREDFRERQRMRRPYELSWQLDMNFNMGNQYCDISPRGEVVQEDKYYFWQEKQVYNHISTIVDTRVSRLNRVRPQPMARPFGNSEADVNAAKLSTRILAAFYQCKHMPEIISQATVWSEVCGTAFYKVCWDADRQDVQVSVCSPFEIYPDSNVASDIADCSSIIHAKVCPAREVEECWGVPVKGESIKIYAIDGAQSVGGLGYNSVVPSIVQEAKNDQVLVIERYTKPSEMYKKGKLEIVAGETLLYSGELPYTLGEEGEFAFPFVRQVSLPQAGCFWGTSMVERVIPIQRAFNAVKNRKHEFLNRIAMGVLTVEDGSVDTDNLEEEGLSPGKVLVYRQGASKPALMESGSVPNDFAQEEEQLLQEFISVSGVSEFARNSSTPSQVTSGVALQLIAEQDDMRLANSVDSIRLCIKRIAEYVLRLYKQYVTDSRLMRYTDGNGAEVFYFTGSDVSCDDVVFETETELSDSLATRRSMLFELLRAGVLSDGDGNLSASSKAKILSLMGFGNWESAQDSARLHAARAARENADISAAEVLPVDDHALHIEEHTKHLIGLEPEEARAKRDGMLAHIAEHRKYLKGE